MRTDLSPGERSFRAVVFGVIAVSLAVGAHWSASGMAPSWQVVVLATGVSIVLGRWIGMRSRGAYLLVTLTVVSQLALHASFGWSMGGRGVTMLLCGTPHAESEQLAASMLKAQVGAGGGQPWSATALLMLAAHLVAAAVVGLWLRQGEWVLDEMADALVMLRGCWRTLLAVLLVLVSPPATLRSILAATSSRVSALRGRAVGASGLRGPPRVACLFEG